MLETFIIPALQQWGVPTAMTGLFVWLLKRHIDRQEKQRTEQEHNREKLDKTLIQSTTAALALSEATARAVQRIPDAHCNGDMKSALAEAEKIQKEEQAFLVNQGVQHIFGD
jgi:Na+/phosphate symporter